MAARYSLVITPHPSGGFSGSSVEMPLVFGRGASEAQCALDVRQAVAHTIDSLRESGEPVPAPALLDRREVQVNIRLTPDERFRIREKARVAGFRSISDYMRRAALRGVA